MGAAMLRPDAQACLAGDFAAMMETMALTAGMTLTSEDKKVPTGLEN
jgi:3-hydroxyisobutyrate dehydrogenase